MHTTKQLNAKQLATHCTSTNTIYIYKTKTPFYEVTANSAKHVIRKPDATQLAEFDALLTTLQFTVKQLQQKKARKSA
jgi:hypothetical protein